MSEPPAVAGGPVPRSLRAKKARPLPQAVLTKEKGRL